MNIHECHALILDYGVMTVLNVERGGFLRELLLLESHTLMH